MRVVNDIGRDVELSNERENAVHWEGTPLNMRRPRYAAPDVTRYHSRLSSPSPSKIDEPRARRCQASLLATLVPRYELRSMYRSRL